MLQDSKFLKNSNVVFLLFAFLCILISTNVTRSQTRGTNLPGPGVREGNRSMDDYDRAINRMKNDAKAANERRRNLFPQINEDFQRLQVIHNEIVRMLQPEKVLNYDRLAELTDDMKKRGSRLRENLALPESEKTETPPDHPEPIDETHIKDRVFALHDVIAGFVANPIFKNLGVVDAKEIYSASGQLDSIINLSDEIKREAKALNKSAKK